jgi:hypothetical protein
MPSRARRGAAPDRERDQAVGEPGVLRQQGPVKVGADQIAPFDALAAVGAVVAVTVQDAAEGLRPGPEVCAPAVVLEARQHLPALTDVDLDRHVSDQARPGVANRLQIGDAEAGDRSISQLIAVAEQLVAAADGEQSGAILDGRRDRLTLRPQHVLGNEHLIAVLPAPDVDQVMRARIESLAGAGGGVLEGDAAPLTAALQEEDVAAIRVDVHLLGVEGEQTEA